MTSCSFSKAIASALIACALSCCSNPGSNKKDTPAAGKANDSGRPAVIPVPDSAKPNTTKSDLGYLEKLNGKYPYDVKLLDNPALTNRLKQLLGTRFAFLKETWAVESPIEVKDGIFTASACQAHNCGNTNFMIVVDLRKNLVYAGVREEQAVKLYAEDNSNIPVLTDWAQQK